MEGDTGRDVDEVPRDYFDRAAGLYPNGPSLVLAPRRDAVAFSTDAIHDAATANSVDAQQPAFRP